MAITKIHTEPVIDNNERGITMKTQKPVKPGQTMPINIPKLMPYMPKGGPNNFSTVTIGNMIFANDQSCKPNAPSVIRSHNYISPKFENNATWSGIVEDEEKDDVPAGTNVKVTFVSGNILNPTFNPN